MSLIGAHVASHYPVCFQHINKGPGIGDNGGNLKFQGSHTFPKFGNIWKKRYWTAAAIVSMFQVVYWNISNKDHNAAIKVGHVDNIILYSIVLSCNMHM